MNRFQQEQKTAREAMEQKVLKGLRHFSDSGVTEPIYIMDIALTCDNDPSSPKTCFSKDESTMAALGRYLQSLRKQNKIRHSLTNGWTLIQS